MTKTTVLIAGRDVELREAVAAEVEQAGYASVCIAECDTAVATVLATVEPVVVIVCTPTAVDCARLAHLAAIRPNARVLVLSPEKAPHYPGASAVLRMPFEPSELLDALGKCD